MDIWLIAGIIIFGLIVIMVEIFLVPGTTLIGVIGGIIVVIGIYFSFAEHGTKVGSITLALSTIATGLLMYAGFKAYTSKKFSLNDTVSGRVNEPEENFPKVGDEGVTVSFLRPNGKAIINGNKTEVYSLSEYIESSKKIKVVKISENKIFVKLINGNS